MAHGIRGLVGRVSERFKRRFYGPTFRCPVCHLELAHADLDTNGLMVCPLCGVVLDVEAVYGHAVPVVLEVEIHRPQPKLRLHPMATHVPIGLFPFALAGAALLVAGSFLSRLAAGAGEWPVRPTTVAGAVLVLLIVSMGASVLTVASGLWDWTFRYRRRPYRQIAVKIAFSVAFVVLGAMAVALHASGWVFSPVTGFVDLASPTHVAAAAAYLLVLTANMVVLATLGHIGGTLVFGR